jgi:uncharacterized Tic20 family protein
VLFLSFVLPLVIRIAYGKTDAFVRHHATEALNAQITFGIAWNLFGIPAQVGYWITGNPKFGLIGIGSGVALLWIVVTSILGAVHASRGEWWRYPGSVRLVGRRVRQASRVE